MASPVLASLHVFPVKAAQGHAPDQAFVEPWGISGDRRWMLVDDSAKVVTQRQHARLALTRAEPLPGGAVRLSAPDRAPLTVTVPDPVHRTSVQIWGDKVEAVPADEAAGDWFSAFLGIEVRLVHLADPAVNRPIDPDYAHRGETVSFADGFPLLVTSLASLDALNALIAQGDHAQEGPLPMNRFRPNLVVTGTEAWAEDHWSRIAVGEVTFRVAKKCGRCAVTTTDQHTAVRGREPLRTLARHRRIDGKLVFGQNLVPEHPGTLRVGDPLTVLG
ncbi:MOSC domain-containing protein [Streptomyces sp. NPDC005955]|uniref:MOSC domain-containing protein n=1 Tax=Streptomyces sp. NPDC005955 TaxID=3364738 RepID=UPI003688EE00